MNRKTPIEKAVLKAGSRAILAKHLEVTPEAVRQWVKSNTVPSKRVIAIEALTGIHRSALRPDLYPSE